LDTRADGEEHPEEVWKEDREIARDVLRLGARPRSVWIGIYGSLSLSVVAAMCQLYVPAIFLFFGFPAGVLWMRLFEKLIRDEKQERLDLLQERAGVERGVMIMISDRAPNRFFNGTRPDSHG
jgi:hypothetical protein